MTAPQSAPLASNPDVATPLEIQQRASDPSASVWVNASAGSGKTSVLTARVTRLLLAGGRPEKILCLTYTRAGAAEMTNRLTELFGKWVGCDDDALRDDLHRLQGDAPDPRQMATARRLFAEVLSCPGGLRIRTIHSFCREILSRFPIEAQLPPHFGLIDEREQEKTKAEALNDLLAEAAAFPDSPLAQSFRFLVDAQSETGFDALMREAVRESASIDPDSLPEWRHRLRRFLDLEESDTPQSLRRAAMRDIPADALWPIAKWIAQDSAPKQKQWRPLSEILDTPPDTRESRINDWVRLFLTADGLPRKSKSLAAKETLARHPDFLPLCEREAARLLSCLERIESAEIATVTEAVLTFGAALRQKIAARKAARAALDYDDLIARTVSLLRQPGIGAWVAYKLDQGIDHILVDEAQDTSRAQWAIVQALTEEFFSGQGSRDGVERTLFVVGDEKQSIFSFQNADPESFLSLRDFFAHRIAESGRTLNQVPMRTSFRSAPAILKAVDAVFANDEARQGVSRDPVSHTPFKNRNDKDKAGRVELWPLLKDDRAEAANGTEADGAWAMPVDYEEERDPQAELAHHIAQRIKIWVSSKEILPGTDRPVRPGDVMILLRRRGRFADLMVRALKAAQVPVTGIDRMRLMLQLPVMDLLAVLRFALLPEDDLNLAALLRGPFIGFDEDQLMRLAIGRQGSLWQSLQEKSDKRECFSAARDYLAAHLAKADLSTPFAFLSGLLDLPCPADPISGRRALWRRLGEEALDPIDELLNAAQRFCSRDAPSLQNFLQSLIVSDAEIKRELDHGDRSGQTDGQVRIMTVHASKGLEAPIVFLPDTASTPRATDIPKMQWTEGQAPAPIFLLRKPSGAAARRVWQAARDRQLEEYRRLLYVAMTRASNRLYICGWQAARGEDSTAAHWHSLATKGLRPLHQAEKAAPDETGLTPDIVYADPAPPAIDPATAPKKDPPRASFLPAWANHPLAPEASHFRTAPSTALRDAPAAATPNNAFARGRLIHRLLQTLPDIAPPQRPTATARFLAQPSLGLNDAQRADITREVNALVQDERFMALFGPDSRAEIALTGMLNGAPAFRQIDRLCLRGDEVWIVDYKTNRPPPQEAQDIPLAYKEQMNEYRSLLSGIYPGNHVRCFLLWTYTAHLMEIALEAAPG